MMSFKHSNIVQAYDFITWTHSSRGAHPTGSRGTHESRDSHPSHPSSGQLAQQHPAALRNGDDSAEAVVGGTPMRPAAAAADQQAAAVPLPPAEYQGFIRDLDRSGQGATPFANAPPAAAARSRPLSPPALSGAAAAAAATPPPMARASSDEQQQMMPMQRVTYIPLGAGDAARGGGGIHAAEPPLSPAAAPSDSHAALPAAPIPLTIQTSSVLSHSRSLSASIHPQSSLGPSSSNHPQSSLGPTSSTALRSTTLVPMGVLPSTSRLHSSDAGAGDAQPGSLQIGDTPGGSAGGEGSASAEAQTWLIAEYCDGGTLADLVAQGRMLDDGTRVPHMVRAGLGRAAL